MYVLIFCCAHSQARQVWAIWCRNYTQQQATRTIFEAWRHSLHARQLHRRQVDMQGVVHLTQRNHRLVGDCLTWWQLRTRVITQIRMAEGFARVYRQREALRVWIQSFEKSQGLKAAAKKVTLAHGQNQKLHVMQVWTRRLLQSQHKAIERRELLHDYICAWRGIII